MDQHQQASAIHESFNKSKITFKGDRSSVLARFKGNGQRSITFDEDGAAWTKYDSEVMLLEDALRRYAVDNRDEADGRTLPRAEAVQGRPALQSKADYVTAADKARFVREHGIEAWESLPLRTPKTSEVVFKEDFFGLSVAEKTRRIQADPDIISKLPSRPRNTFAETQAKIDAAKSRHAQELNALQAQDLGVA